MLQLLLTFVLFCYFRDVVISEDTNPKLPEKVIYSLDNVDQLFDEFTKKYNKKYSAADVEHRREIFKDNLIKINQWNLEQPTTVFDIGPFTDMTHSEFLRIYGGCLGNFTTDNAEKYEPIGMAPESLDWRESNVITRVKDQKSCGSCYVFSAIGNIEALHAQRHGQLIELSEQQGLDCNPRGCEGGFPHEVMQTMAKEGCMKELDYAYENAKRQCRTNANTVVVRVSGGRQISVGSEEGLKDAVANYGPLAISFSTEPRMIQYRGGVFMPEQCQNSQSYHAVLLVGYGTDRGTPYWLMKNSWGEQWGERGYFRIVRGQNACHIGSYAATASIA